MRKPHDKKYRWIKRKTKNRKEFFTSKEYLENQKQYEKENAKVPGRKGTSI
jgi:hypothetical protein